MPGKPGRQVGLVGGLVAAESRIPIDSIDRLLGICNVRRSELRQLGVDGLRQGHHWRLYFVLEKLLAWQEPVAIIIAGEPAKEGDGFGWESWKHHINIAHASSAPL